MQTKRSAVISLSKERDEFEATLSQTAGQLERLQEADGIVQSQMAEISRLRNDARAAAEALASKTNEMTSYTQTQVMPIPRHDLLTVASPHIHLTRC